MTQLYAAQYSLRQVDGPVRDQLNTGACWSFATTTIVDTIMRQAGHELEPLSPLAYYAQTRDLQRTFNTDSGTFTKAGMQAAVQYGFAKESSWVYDENNLYVHPTQAVVDEASHTTVTSWTTVNIYQNYANLANTVKGLLSEGKPVLLAFLPQDYFFNEHGSLDTLSNLGHDMYKGGHAVEIIGTDDTLNGGSYIIHNSWSTSFGDNGYGVISYKQFDPQPNINEMMGMYTIDGMKIDGHVYDFKYTAAKSVVSEYYACILERAAEITGLEFWTNKNLAHTDLANLLINSTEGQQMYGSLSNTAFVENMYENVLGRHSDQAGLDYFVGFLNNGQSRGQVISGMMDYLYANSADAVSHQYLVDKVNLSNYMSIALQYAGGHDPQTHDVLAQTTSDVQQTEILKIGLPELLHGSALHGVV